MLDLKKTDELMELEENKQLDMDFAKHVDKQMEEMLNVQILFAILLVPLINCFFIPIAYGEHLPIAMMAFPQIINQVYLVKSAIFPDPMRMLDLYCSGILIEIVLGFGFYQEGNEYLDFIQMIATTPASIYFIAITAFSILQLTNIVIFNHYAEYRSVFNQYLFDTFKFF